MQVDKSGTAKKLLAALVGVVLLMFVFFSNFALVVFDNSHYQEQFETLNRVEATGMEEEELMRVTEEILDYLMLQRDDVNLEAEIQGEQVQLFTEREIIHMEDVRELFKSGYILLTTVIIILMALLYLGASYLNFRFQNFNRLTGLLYLLRWGALVSLGITVLIGGIFFAGFNFWYTQLHVWFFDNVYWILDPEIHNLINIYPVEFFYNTLVRISLRTLGHLALVFVITLTFSKVSLPGSKKGKHKAGA